tara:strand:+ start:51 stop:257 length:207 start_codon:yes stop_codon:yes gene_type:complete
MTTNDNNKFFPSSFATLIRREMRKNKITIKHFAEFSGCTQKRVREVRSTGEAENQDEWILTLAECAAS